MRKQVVYLLIVLSFGVLFSCRTNKQDKIVGAWKFVPHTKPDSLSTLYWYFSAGDKLELVTVTEEDSLVKPYTYSVEASQLTIYGDDAIIGPYHPSPTEFRGKFWIDVIDKKYLKITKTEHIDDREGNAYLRVELVKQ